MYWTVSKTRKTIKIKLFSHPILCNYYLTYRCNAKCSFCDIWEKPSPYISLKNVEENLRSLKKLGVKIIDFTGGEPLLHRELHKFLRLAKEAGFLTTVTTNALLYPKRAEQLKGLVDMLHFSLDFFDKEKHNEKRGVPCYDFVLESIQIAESLGEKPDILMTVWDENVNEIEKIYYNITRPNNLILILNPIFSYGDVEEKLSNKHFPLLRLWSKKPGVYLNTAFMDLAEAGGNSSKNPVCFATDAVVVISPENELLLPCYHLAREKFPIKNNLENLWHSDEVRRIRRQGGRYDFCEGCTINCYMEPSFAFGIHKYFLASSISTLKYVLEKWHWKLP